MHEEDKNNTDHVSDTSPIVGHIREKFQQSETSRVLKHSGEDTENMSKLTIPKSLKRHPETMPNAF